MRIFLIIFSGIISVLTVIWLFAFEGVGVVGGVGRVVAG